MVVSATGDQSNTDHFTTSESIPDWRLVPNDNNIGMRTVVPTSGESAPSEESGATTVTSSSGPSSVSASSERAVAAEANEDSWGIKRHGLIGTIAGERMQSQKAREEIVRIFEESNAEFSLGECARWADRIKFDPPASRSRSLEAPLRPRATPVAARR